LRDGGKRGKKEEKGGNPTPNPGGERKEGREKKREETAIYVVIAHWVALLF